MKSKYIVFAAMGFELVGIILGCIFIGQHLDKNYGTKGLGIVVLSVLGLTGWLVHVITLLRRMENQQDVP